ncbi:MAG: tetratricopeptide repeat protein [Azoarcus sp.]|jgi:Flp pilus assembly protein TadD|nr:tetratricopeptide repeat protein [Azoarcus sp.]
MSKGKWLVSFLVISISVLGGCVSNNVVMTNEEFIQAMGQSNVRVDSLLEKGESNEAVTEAVAVLADLAKRNPTRKEPWGRMAKIQFDSGNYAQAIVSAEEVLQRDGTDRTAKSIRAVAGLRVASQSLADLRNDVELKGNARADAASLAAVMRETLGEDVLVPASELEARKKREAAAAARAKAKASRPQAVPVAVPDAQQPARGGNPFSQLK